METADLLILCLVLVAACEEKKPITETAKSDPSKATVSAPVAPPAPKPPVVTIDDMSVVVSGDRIEYAGGDPKGRIVGALASKPLVRGETLEINAMRETTMQHLVIVFDALGEAKAKGAKVKTATRDRSMAELAVVFDHPAPAACTAVAMIAKDNAVLVWPAAGGTALRFAHGMAGPDVTLGSDGLRKLAASCESSFYMVAGDDNIKWGLVFDVALAAGGGPDGGAVFRPTSAIVVTKTPVPGRKVD